MQLIWVSGPTGKVVTVSITLRRVVAFIVLSCAALLAFGALLNLLGLRIAVDYSPQLVHRIGGVSSADDHRRLEERYRARLAELQGELTSLGERFGAVERSRRELVSLLGIRDALADAMPPPAEGQGLARGGPMRLIADSLPWGGGLEGAFVRAQRTAVRLGGDMESLRTHLVRDLDRLLVLPVTLPLVDAFVVSSGFGVRPDPFSGLRSLHEGVDFIAPRGTPVLATAPGRVVRSGFFPDWGHMVEIAHASGFMTRYAHLDHRVVGEGQEVARGAVLGVLGNSGRSTGAHLHYEIVRHGKPVDPAGVVPALALAR